MPVIRVNASAQGLELHGLARAGLGRELRDGLAVAQGPIIVMIHGYKYQPGQHAYCPHRSIFATDQTHGPAAWPRNLGFGTGFPDEGLGIAFGWDARGHLPAVYRRARDTGQQLASLLLELNRAAPERPVHILAHSLGAEVAFEALHHLPAGTIDRLITLTGASFRSTAREAMRSAAGASAELLNVSSRENDLFDFLFECLIRAPEPGDCAIGHGLNERNIATLQLDHPAHLAALAGLGHQVAPARRRICHWSGYMRPGVLRLWAQAMRNPERLPLALMAPTPPAPRWSRLIGWPGAGGAVGSLEIGMPGNTQGQG